MRALSENQRGSSASMSFRIDDEYGTRIINTVDDSTYNLSSLIRAFVVAGYELLDSDNPSIMPREIEKLWRDLNAVKEERARRHAFEKYQGEMAQVNGQNDEEKEAMAAKIERLEAIVAKLAQEGSAEKSKSKRKSQ